MTRRLVRFGCTAAMAFCICGEPRRDCRGQDPEPLPAYVDAESSRQDATLRGVAFDPSARQAIACGDRGTILRSDDAGRTWTEVNSTVDCVLTDVVWVNARRVVAVGGAYDRITGISRGVVLLSDDGGRSWSRSADRELPRLGTLRLRQDGSLEAAGDWSDSLLTDHLQSFDGGRTWNAVNNRDSESDTPTPLTSQQLQSWVAATGVPFVVRDACRAGRSTWCAVGDHGLVLMSDDQGRNWSPVRGQGRRTAILCVASDPESVAWSLIGKESMDHRHRVAIAIAAPPPADDANSRKRLARCRQVAAMMGGSGADRIAASSEQESRRWLRVHRPAVLLLDETLSPSARTHWTAAAAASGVQRVASYSFGIGGRWVLRGDAILPKTGVLARDLDSDALQIIKPSLVPRGSVSLRFHYDESAAGRNSHSLCDALRLAPGQRLFAAAAPSSRRQLQIVQARSRQHQRLQQLIRSSRSGAQFATGFAQLLDQTEKAHQFRAAWNAYLDVTQSMSDDSARSAELADVILEEIGQRFSGTSAALWSQLRRDAMRQSDEWRRLRPLLQPSRALAASTPDVVVSPFQTSDSGVRQVSTTSPIVVPKPEMRRIDSRTDGGKPTEVDLAWEFHPLQLLWRESLRRRGTDGRLQPEEGTSANLQRLAASAATPWSRLLQPGGSSVVKARGTDTPPRLDGRLTDPCWNNALPSAGQTLSVRYDDDYVYLAVVFASDRSYADADAATSVAEGEPETSRRSRDHDLSHVDRVQIRIDVDRDLITSYQLEIGGDGRVFDAIDGHAQWQPTWYVDRRNENGRATCELAILRRDLVDLPMTIGENWFVSVTPLRAGQSSDAATIPDPKDWVSVVVRP